MPLSLTAQQELSQQAPLCVHSMGRARVEKKQTFSKIPPRDLGGALGKNEKEV